MAAPLLLVQRHCRLSYLSVAGRCLSSSGLAPPRPVHTRVLLYLAQRFHDVEKFLTWTSGLKKWRLKKKNAFYGYTQVNYGDNIATAYYVLCLGGGVRYAGQSQWFRSDRRGRFTWDFMNHKDSPVEEVDASNTVIDYSGLENLVRQRGLRSLSLRGCEEVDDWFLSRLHVFQDSLEELDISHCPLITAGGLAALGNLRNLHRLDVSSLPRLQSPGLVVILLEEMLPHCHVTAAGYDHHRLALEPLEDQGEELGRG
ncbi:distal membrane-arm assembly complex protein 2 [Osmerus mordax]|uniref:distal membrane-arm assembly complex protein 2 n=1 Tax=Osmerus mordax TaxID=8014 RepID=UPI0035107897